MVVIWVLYFPMKNRTPEKNLQLPILATQFLNPGYDTALGWDNTYSTRDI